MNSVIDQFAAGLQGQGHTLVLPEGTDERILNAARVLCDRNLAHVVLPGSVDAIQAAAVRAGVPTGGLSLINIADADSLDAYAQSYLELRPGAKVGVARRLVSKPLFFAGSMLKAGHADAMIAGVANTTAKVIEAALMTVGKAESIDTPSSCFLMLLPNVDGSERSMIFADCALNVEPTSEQLADIAVASAKTAEFLLGKAPRVALLSFSSKGSGKHRLASKVADAAARAATRAPQAAIDGELQVDTALDEAVARLKVDPPGEVAGRANVLVFPDLNSGNIAYKLTRYLAGARAIGPLLQGFACPIADLSRGATVEDIVDTAIVTLARIAARK